MDTQYAFRSSYEEARKIKVAQDNYCEKVEAREWNGLGDFPDSLQWEALVDVLRGRVKIHNHCYEAVDFDGMVRVRRRFDLQPPSADVVSPAYPRVQVPHCW